MIRIEPLSDGGAMVNLTTRQPLVYLDQWALYKFANEEPLRTRLLKVFETKGTLMFSWMNSAEIATLEGDSRKKMEVLLEGVGVHWFPLNFRFGEVMEREDMRQQNAPFDEEFVKQFYPFIHGDEVLSLSKVVQLTEHGIADIKASLESHKTNTLNFIAEKRREVKKQPELLKKFATVPFDPTHPSRHVFIEILRPIISGANPLSKNDAVDVFHAVVASAYCDVVLLDGKWAQTVKGLQLPPNRLRVYSPKEVTAFLDFMEKAQLASQSEP